MAGPTLMVGGRYVRRNGTITGPLMYPLDVNQHFDTFFLLDTETGYFFDAEDTEYGHLVNAGRRFTDGDLRLNGLDLVEDYTEDA